MKMDIMGTRRAENHLQKAPKLFKECGGAMADERHLNILTQGVEFWNRWRRQNPDIRPDLILADLDGADLNGIDLNGAMLSAVNLCGATLKRATLRDAILIQASLTRATFDQAYLTDANLREANLRNASLRGANLVRATFHRADMSGANLSQAVLIEADLRWAKLIKADVHGADLVGADLRSTDLREANLAGADLTSASLVETHLEEARLTGCHVYGISAWNLQLEGTEQSDLVVTRSGEQQITVDNLEVAQFIYLLLNNQKIRDVIDTITSKVVLILGRFTPERKAVLEAIRDNLRACNYLPVLFDFRKPRSRDTQETITTLARLARFIVADITNPRSIPQELVSIVETLPSVPVQPLLQTGSMPWGMYDHIKHYPWVLKVHKYSSANDLLTSLGQGALMPAERRATALAGRRGE